MSQARTNLLQGTLDLLILKALGAGELHGLGISRRIEQITKGTFLVKPGSLFPALHRMEEAGWLSSFWGESENNRRAKFYRLTRIGIKQIGSSRASLLRLVIKQAARPIMLGCLIGAGAAFASGKLLAGFLFEVTPRDAVSFSFALGLMAAVAIMASTIPAVQAARTNLVSVLRSE